MILNYIKLALRSLQREKLYSIINVFSLSIGLTILFLFSSLFIYHISFDKFHKDSDQIHLITSHKNLDNGVEQLDAYTYLPVASQLKEQFTEIEDATIVRKYFRDVFKVDDALLNESRAYHVDNNFLNIFNHPIVAGDTISPLSQPKNVVMTESTARKYFGNENPIGQIIINDYDESAHIVTAVIEDCPSNSSFEFDMLIGLHNGFENDWSLAGRTHTFIKINQHVEPDQLTDALSFFAKNKVPPLKDTNTSFGLLPLTDLHLRSLHVQSGFYNEPIFQYYWLLTVAIGLLVIVTANLVILSTSRYAYRAKEVGLRKVIGARKWHLIQQYLTESTLVAFFSFPMALILFDLVKPQFLAIIGGNAQLPLWERPDLVIGALGVTLLIGVLSGLYPAFFLSSFKIVNTLKGRINLSPQKYDFKKALVVFQFVLSFTIIALTIVIVKQLELLTTADLGYNRENLITIEVNNDFSEKSDLIEAELARHPQITSVATGHMLPYSWGRQEKMRKKGTHPDQSENIYSYACGYNFIETLEMEIIEGRSFSREFNEDRTILISESAADYFGWDDPIGQSLIIDDRDGQERKVIGVLKDFHFPHVFFKRAPAVMYLLHDEPYYLFVKTDGKADQQTLAFIENKWDEMVPELPFEHTTVDYDFREDLRTTLKSFRLIQYTAYLSVFIACLGLFALSAYTIERRTKEIGIRRAVGATVGSILQMLLFNFIKLVGIGILLALPIAYFTSDYVISMGWVEQIDIGISIFALAILILVSTALITVSGQSYWAARSNPIDSLKYE